MINRNLVKCKSCDHTLWLRVEQPETKKDEYLYSCPDCHLETTLSVKITKNNVLIESEECEVIEIEDYHLEELPTNVITLSSHYPVFPDVQDKDLTKGGSPKLYFFAKNIQGGQRYNDVLIYFSGMKEHMLHEHLKIVSALDSQNWVQVRDLLVASRFSIRNDIGSISEPQLVYEVYSHLSILFFTLLGIGKREVLYNEYYDALNTCISSNVDSYYSLLRDFHTKHQYLTNRSKLFDIHKRLLKNVESYMAGFIYEYSSDEFKSEIHRCRLYRSDFDTVKGLYVDVFELISKTTIYMVLILNLAKRGHFDSFSVPNMTVGKLKKLTSYNRLRLLEEFPGIHDLFQSVSRKMRNEIGHFSARYDVGTGYIKYDSGKSEHYLVFLNNLLQAIKALKIIYTVYSKVDLDFVQYKNPNRQE